MKLKVCIVSGAANGIGSQICKCFDNNGYKCIGLDYDEENLNKMQDCEWKLYYDLMDIDYYEKIEEEIIQYTLGAEDITLINNLGGSRETNQNGRLWDNFLSTFEFNMKSLVNLTEIGIRCMKRIGHGRIVNISSISGRYNLETIDEDYAAAKSSIIGFSRIKANKLAESNILVNTVCPGIISTDRITKRWMERDEEYNQKILNQIPLKRLGTPQEVAEVVAFLGGEKNTYITGAVLDVNGGMYMP